ncbi:MAG: phage terminase large subunit family protein [Thermodesulfobacteriota bacterium]
MPTAAEVYNAAWRDGLTPDPEYWLDEWADQRRFLPRKAASEPGQWRTERTPYLRDIMRELSPASPTREVALCKGSQTGGTETIINFMLAVADIWPGPMLVVQPTVDIAERFSKQRINPSIKICPSLKGKITASKSRDGSNTMLQKDFPGGTMILGGANSAAALRSMPIRFLLMDEVSAYPFDVDGEGDPVDLALKRTTNFKRRKIFYNSTPGEAATCRITKQFKRGDQRYYHVPCPHCGGMQVIAWKSIKWPEGRPDLAHMVCEHCGEVITEHHKTWMLARGEWQAHNSGAEMVSFHLSALYSPLGWYSWGQAAADFIAAKGDREKLKVWVTHVLAEAWEEAGQTVEASFLAKRRERYAAEVPDGVLLLTVGGDTQDDRIELEVVGWGHGRESWSIDYKVFWGKPDQPTLWADIDRYLTRTWRHAAGLNLYVAAALIDSQGHYTNQVQAFTGPREFRRVYACKGIGGPGVPLVGKPGRNNRSNALQFPVGVDAAKAALYYRLRLVDSGPGYCHFPEGRPETYFEQLTAEKQVTRFHKGRPIIEWVKKPHARNEALDCRVYATAALEILNVDLDALTGPVAASPRPPAQRGRRVLSSGVEVYE